MKNLILISILGLLSLASCGTVENTVSDSDKFQYNFIDELDRDWYLEDPYGPIYRDPYMSFHFDRRRKMMNHLRFWNQQKN